MLNRWIAAVLHGMSLSPRRRLWEAFSFPVPGGGRDQEHWQEGAKGTAERASSVLQTFQPPRFLAPNSAEIIGNQHLK